MEKDVNNPNQPNSSGKVDSYELRKNSMHISETLTRYGIEISSIQATVGATVTLYEINPVPGIRISKINALKDEIASGLTNSNIRIIAPIPGKDTVGIEVPNQKLPTAEAGLDPQK